MIKHLVFDKSKKISIFDHSRYAEQLIKDFPSLVMESVEIKEDNDADVIPVSVSIQKVNPIYLESEITKADAKDIDFSLKSQGLFGFEL